MKVIHDRMILVNHREAKQLAKANDIAWPIDTNTSHLLKSGAKMHKTHNRRYKIHGYSNKDAFEALYTIAEC